MRQMIRSARALAAVTLVGLTLAGCGQGAPLTTAARTQSAAQAASLFGKLPKGRELTDAERTANFDYFLGLATKEAQKWDAKARLLVASGEDLDQAGARTLKGSYSFYFHTSWIDGLKVTVKGNRVDFSRAVLSTARRTLTGSQDVPATFMPAAKAMEAALATKRLRKAEFTVVLALPRNYTSPVYQVWEYDRIPNLLKDGFNRHVTVNAGSGAVVTAQEEAQIDLNGAMQLADEVAGAQ